jgi:hypothetical protein
MISDWVNFASADCLKVMFGLNFNVPWNFTGVLLFGICVASVAELQVLLNRPVTENVSTTV